MMLVDKLRAEDLFGELKREEKQGLSKKFEYSGNPIMSELFGNFQRLLERNLDEIYAKSNNGKLILGLPSDFTDIEINEIIRLLPKIYGISKKFENYYEIFINQLIKESREIEFNLDTTTSNVILDSLGAVNKSKKIFVKGDVGSHTGVFMQGGEIIIKGKTMHSIGMCMEGGCISVYNDTEENVFRQLLGREITGGTIYHNDKKMVYNGRRV